MMQDLTDALNYFKTNLASKHKINPNNIIFMGESAGGQLAATLGCKLGLAAGIKGIVNFYGFNELAWYKTHGNDEGGWLSSLKKYIGSILIVCVAFFLQRIVGAVSSWYKENVAKKTTTRLDDELIPLIRRTIKTGIWIVAFLVILPLYGVNISALIATLGVSSLAIALAAQDTIANIIAGFLIMIDRPFRVGDKIKIPTGEIVEVLDIGIRRSKFLAEDKAIIIVPNLDLSKSKIINYTYGQERK